MPSAPAQVMVYTRAPVEALSPYIACVEQLDPTSTQDTSHPGSEGFKWPTAGQDPAPRAGEERPGGWPWFKTKAEMPGPASHWPTAVRETLSPCLAHSFYSVQKRQKPHRSHFQNLDFGVHTLKNEFCLVGIAQHGEKPPVGPKSALELGWLQSTKDKGRTGRCWGRGPGAWGRGALFTRDCQPHLPGAGRTLGPPRWGSGASSNGNPPLSSPEGTSLDAQTFPCSHGPGEKQPRMPLVWGVGRMPHRPAHHEIRHRSSVDPERTSPTLCRRGSSGT